MLPSTKKRKKQDGSSSSIINPKETGKVKAVLVGINYRGTRNELGGCINDVLGTKRQILAEYPTAEIELMTDDTPVKPTRNNILDKLTSLVYKAQAGDTLMFHYSGHGSQVPDLEGDEEDGYDETICPIDFMTRRTVTVNGIRRILDSQITDDEIHSVISNVPKNVKFLMLSDSCHSGTIGDLKYDFTHYHGPSEWRDDGQSSSTEQSSVTEQQQPSVTEQSAVQSSITPTNTYNCNTNWSFAQHSLELWLTPLNWSLYKIFGHLKIKLTSASEVPEQLLNNSSQKCDTVFEQLEDGTYRISAPELGTAKFIANPLTIDLDKNRSLNIEAGIHFHPAATMLAELFSIDATLKYNYETETGKHNHYSGKKKRSLKMKTINCDGGELRIISGCEEDQTSADTGTNGACTKAFWDTVRSLGGLHQFFPKLFSHHIEDLKFIQDTINYNLSRFGFTQHSIISWDHAHGASSRDTSFSEAIPVLAESTVWEEESKPSAGMSLRKRQRPGI